MQYTFYILTESGRPPKQQFGNHLVNQAFGSMPNDEDLHVSARAGTPWADVKALREAIQEDPEHSVVAAVTMLPAGFYRMAIVWPDGMGKLLEALSAAGPGDSSWKVSRKVADGIRKEKKKR